MSTGKTMNSMNAAAIIQVWRHPIQPIRKTAIDGSAASPADIPIPAILIALPRPDVKNQTMSGLAEVNHQTLTALTQQKERDHQDQDVRRQTSKQDRTAIKDH